MPFHISLYLGLQTEKDGQVSAADNARHPGDAVLVSQMLETASTMIRSRPKPFPAPASIASSGSRRRFLRPHPEPFPRLDVSSAGCRPTEAARMAAEAMTIVIGPSSDAERRYLDAFSYAERHLLAALKKRGCAILMAPSIALGLDSMPAARRRGRVLTEGERGGNRREYGPDSGVIAIYDPSIDSLVLPTGRSVHDAEHAVLHELGHALTYHAIDGLDFDSVLRDLPAEIARHIAQSAYRGDRRTEVAEVMAEAYALMVVGRGGELNGSIVSALIGILPADGTFPMDPL